MSPQEILGTLLERLMAIRSVNERVFKLICDFIEKLLTDPWAWIPDFERFLCKKPCWVKLDLLYQGRDRDRFLWVVNTVILFSEPWTEEELMGALQRSSRATDFNEINMRQLCFLISQLDELGVTCLLVSQRRKTIMTRAEFCKAYDTQLSF